MLHGLKYDFIEDLLINLRLLKPPPAVLAENGVMRYRIGQRKTNKPTVGDVDPDFLNEASFRTNSVQITDQKHFEQHDRIDARTPIILTIQGAAFFRDKRKVDGFIDFSKQVILGNKVFYVDCFGLKFPGWVRPEHIKTFLRNCFIPNSTKKAVDPSLSTASDREFLPVLFLVVGFFLGVDHVVGGDHQPSPHFLPLRSGDAHLVQGLGHAGEPGLGPGGGDRKGEVAGPEHGMAVFLAVQGRAAEKLGEKEALLLHDRSDVLGKQRSKQRMGLYPRVEGGHQAGDRVGAADSFVQTLGFRHAPAAPSRFISRKARSTASMVRSMSSSEWAMVKNQASYFEAGRWTPLSSIRWKKRAKVSPSAAFAPS